MSVQTTMNMEESIPYLLFTVSGLALLFDVGSTDYFEAAWFISLAGILIIESGKRRRETV
jgi:hypothetical protein